MVESRQSLNPNSHDGETYLSRFLKITPIDFPVQNPINLTTYVNGVDIKLHTVEYPNEGELKGVIFVFLGYGAFQDFYGGYFKDIAKAGFRIFGFDRHGFGRSEGARGETGPDPMGDQWRFVDSIVEHFKLQDAKKFIFGISLGGLLGMRMMQMRPDYFCGAMLNMPWFDMPENKQFGFFKRFGLKIASKLFKNRTIPMPSNGQEYDEFLAHMVKDPRFTGFIQYHMAEFALTMQDEMNANLEHIPNVPFFIAMAETDLNVSNTRIREIAAMLKNPKNKTITYENAVHALFYQDGFYQKVMKDACDWLIDVNEMMT
ncbi:UNKNOWN [Stylonychia lemnae]|uniref:Serine aminopeptidase S33 domain-containing protein n=1 Tax=Stylonychia lemnae TaxID=5949 RepID=A0A078AXM9_STYLE|nr:UNKNOWN [Stylonychia lemnae]|eukprot:CDW87220.1 UNKNOWN [Stylonychia lemnae]